MRTLAEMKAERKALVDAQKKIQDTICRKYDEAWKQYWSMEGMYATRKVSTDCYDMHDRGYGFEYANDEIRTKEYYERAKFKEKNIDPMLAEYPMLLYHGMIPTKYDKKIAALDDEISIAKCGMTVAEKKKANKIKAYKKALAEKKAEIAELEEKIAKMEIGG